MKRTLLVLAVWAAAVLLILSQAALILPLLQ